MKLVCRFMRGWLFGIALGAIGWMAWAALERALDAPEVHVSWATRQCVRVVDPVAVAEDRESEWYCGRLPPVYEEVWVP